MHALVATGYIGVLCTMDAVDVAPELGERFLKKAIESKGSHLSTIGQSILFTFAQDLLGEILDRMNVAHGTHAYQQQAGIESAEQYPVWDAVKKNGLIPILEEALFRLFPVCLTHDKGMSWMTGLSSSVVFTLIHNMDSDKDGKILVYYRSLHVLSFILGNYCWYLMKTKGYTHAVAAHVTYNMLVGEIPAILEQYLSKEKEPKELK